MSDQRNSCPFCERIRSGDYDKSDEHAVVFTPLNPVVPGHLLVVARQHVAHAALDPKIAGQVMETAAHIVHGEANIITSIGVGATQTVGHLHLHVVPRHPNDGLMLPWTNQTPGARASDPRAEWWMRVPRAAVVFVLLPILRAARRLLRGR